MEEESQGKTPLSVFGDIGASRQIDLHKMTERNYELLRSFSDAATGHRSCLIGAAVAAPLDMDTPFKDRLIITRIFGLAIPGINQAGTGGTAFYLKFTDGAMRIQQPNYNENVAVRVDLRDCLEELPPGHKLVQVESYINAKLVNPETKQTDEVRGVGFGYRVYNEEHKHWSIRDPDFMEPPAGPVFVCPPGEQDGLDPHARETIMEHIAASGWVVLDVDFWRKKGIVNGNLEEWVENLFPVTPENALEDQRVVGLLQVNDMFRKVSFAPKSPGTIRAINKVMSIRRGQLIAAAKQARKDRELREIHERAEGFVNANTALPESSVPTENSFDSIAKDLRGLSN